MHKQFQPIIQNLFYTLYYNKINKNKSKLPVTTRYPTKLKQNHMSVTSFSLFVSDIYIIPILAPRAKKKHLRKNKKNVAVYEIENGSSIRI